MYEEEIYARVSGKCFIDKSIQAHEGNVGEFKPPYSELVEFASVAQFVEDYAPQRYKCDTNLPPKTTVATVLQRKCQMCALQKVPKQKTTLCFYEKEFRKSYCVTLSVTGQLTQPAKCPICGGHMSLITDHADITVHDVRLNGHVAQLKLCRPQFRCADCRKYSVTPTLDIQPISRGRLTLRLIQSMVSLYTRGMAPGLIAEGYGILPDQIARQTNIVLKTIQRQLLSLTDDYRREPHDLDTVPFDFGDQRYYAVLDLTGTGRLLDIRSEQDFTTFDQFLRTPEAPFPHALANEHSFKSLAYYSFSTAEQQPVSPYFAMILADLMWAASMDTQNSVDAFCSPGFPVVAAAAQLLFQPDRTIRDFSDAVKKILSYSSPVIGRYGKPSQYLYRRALALSHYLTELMETPFHPSTPLSCLSRPTPSQQSQFPPISSLRRSSNLVGGVIGALQEEVVRSNYSFEEITNKLLFFNPAMLPMIHGQHGDELSFVDGKIDVSTLSELGVPLPDLYHLLRNGLLDAQRATPFPESCS